MPGAGALRQVLLFAATCERLGLTADSFTPGDATVCRALHNQFVANAQAVLLAHEIDPEWA